MRTKVEMSGIVVKRRLSCLRDHGKESKLDMALHFSLANITFLALGFTFSNLKFGT